MKSPLCLCLCLIGALSSAVSSLAEVLPLTNAGFESNLAGWTVSTSAAVATPSYAYASLGYRGLRVKDITGAPTYTVTSSPCPATAGETYRLDFWARSLTPHASGIKVHFVFRNAAGADLAPAAAPGFPASREITNSIWFAKLYLRSVAPAGAATVRVKIESLAPYGGGADMDDFELVREVVGEVLPSKYQAYLAEIGGNPSRGQPPPKIVLKLDDLKRDGSGVPAAFVQVANYLGAQQVKASFGLICDSLEGSYPTYTNWIVQQKAGGNVEFWHHGYSSANAEFYGTSYAQQQASLTNGNDLAWSKLGFRLQSFGAPGNAFDATTVAVLTADPHIKVWMYGNAIQPAGKTVLSRAANVNLESPTFVPNHPAFIEGYAHNRGSAYFVLQGHPASWIQGADQSRFLEFQRTIAFLKRADIKATFVFPSSFAAP